MWSRSSDSSFLKFPDAKFSSQNMSNTNLNYNNIIKVNSYL